MMMSNVVSVDTLDDYLHEHPAARITNRQFLAHSVNRKHHQRNNLDRWNYLYQRYRAEYCELRRRLFQKAHGRSIGEISSTDLCFCERYTACVNFTDAKDGLVRHVCDILPIVIGSSVDLLIRRDFWTRGAPHILEDVPKIGFIIQNKNYYNFTACLTTNPKVCHIYRRNAKLQNTEVRLYFYDHNFRGNKLYLKQTLVFEKCDICCGGVVDQDDTSCSSSSTNQKQTCNLELYVLETLMLRNCFKHDYVFLSRRCSDPERHQSVRETVSWMCGYKGARSHLQDRSSYTDNANYRRPTCKDIFPLGGTTRTLKVQCSKNASSFVLCDCSSSDFMQQRHDDPLSIRYENVDKMIELNNTCFTEDDTEAAAVGSDDAVDHDDHDDDDGQENHSRTTVTAVKEKIFMLFVYMHEVLIRNEDIDLLCNKCIFEGPILYGLLMQQLSSYLCDKYPLPALFTDVVDTLVSKMREFSHTGNLYMLISRKTNIRVDLTNDMKRLLKTSVRQEKNHNIDLMSSSSSSSAAAAASNLKTFTGIGGGGGGSGAGNGGKIVGGEQDDEQQLGVVVATTKIDLPAMASGTNTTTTTTTTPTTANTLDKFAANANSDFLVRRKKQRRSVMFDTGQVRNMLENTSMIPAYGPLPPTSGVGGGSSFTPATQKTFYTGLDPYRPSSVLMLYSSVRDYNTRQLLNYGNLQYLLQGISAPHYTDNEFLAEQIKRPPIATQQNSSKCACMPRSFQRFISFYQIGNLSTAGRFMNMAARTKLSFFVHPVVGVADHYYRWFQQTYRDDDNFRMPGLGQLRRSVHHCIDHETYRCSRCFLYLIVNEMPYCSVLVDKRLEHQMFLLSKLRWPAIQFYRKSHVILSVSIQSGIIMIPVSMGGVGRCQDHDEQQQQQQQQDQHYWYWCKQCGLYFPSDQTRFSSSVFRLSYDLAYTYQHQRAKEKEEWVRGGGGGGEEFIDGMMKPCLSHVWFSPNDLDYYRSYHTLNFSAASARPLPLQYEIVCHGAFSCARFIASVDISKTIVSINAAKRRLRLGSQLADRTSSKSPFESIMDQNARIVVYPDVSGWRQAVLPGTTTAVLDDDFMVLKKRMQKEIDAGAGEPRPNEPLQEIVVVPGRNTFFGCFAFGDYEGLNCEDAYVFNERFRPYVENVIELKVNYYKFDRSVIRTNRVQLKFDPSIHLNSGRGCTIKLGVIRSYYKLSFGSTMITVNMSRVRNLYHYTLSYTSNAAYLRRGLKIFEDLPDGRRGLDFLEATVHTSRYNDEDYIRHNSKSTVLTLYDATATTLNGNIVVGAQVSTRQLRFRVSMKNVRTTQKIQNNCGQKGMPVYRDLSDLYTDRGGAVHLIVSSYSLLGRQPLSQLMEQRSFGGCDEAFGPMLRVFSRRAGGRQVGWAGYGEFFFSCDSPHDNIIVSGPNCGNNPMRVCNLTYYAAIDSGLSTAIFNRISDHENYKNNPANGMPLNIYKLLSVYRYFNRDIDLRDFGARRVREQIRDWINVLALGVRAELPQYLQAMLGGIRVAP